MRKKILRWRCQKKSGRPFFGFPDYEISNIARVRNKKTGLIKVPSVGKRGYPVLSIKKDGKSYLKTLHRLFAETWIPNPENKREVNHINGDKCDCSFLNLEWVTPSENMRHARKTGINRTGIGKCARGNTKLKTYKGYEWKYKFE